LLVAEEMAKLSHRVLLPMLGALTLSAPVLAAPPQTAAEPKTDPAVAALERLSDTVQRATLNNGLRVVLDPDHAAPTVAVSVTYDVGSSSEPSGRAGFAHLFEHMMFQGSQHAKKGEHFRLISDRGGSLNGTTNSDRTNYYEVLPANELALALWLEADRMRSLAVTPENFENQRAVVEEEYRMRVQNQAYVPGIMRLGELVFKDYGPYAHDTIGSMADLDAAKFEWVKAFHDQHYTPGNAVLTIAGDFDPQRALELVRLYFSPAESAAERHGRSSPELPPMPDNPNVGRDRVEDRNARTPAVAYGFMTPPARTPDHYALELAGTLLANGESSRLYEQLVHDRGVAESVTAWTEEHRGPDQFSVMAVLTDKGNLPEVESAIDAALARLRDTPPTDQELDKAKRELRASFVFGLQTNLGRAIQLGEFETNFGDARLLGHELARYLAVTPKDVQTAARHWLTPDRASHVEIVPTANGSRS
jgi:predicted Zn-dependent peptidase